MISINISNPDEDPILSKERLPADDNSYRGYTVVKGTFGLNGVYAVGEPRAFSLLGVVTIMSDNFTSVTDILGSQMSAYFGHALVATDVNGDGRDDLIIGAPMYADPNNLIERWEIGRVYVYLQDEDGSFQQSDMLTGTHAAGQFGFSIAALGDINRDGFNDIAVGAPFAGEGRSGIVYIYQGRRKGLKQEISQELRPSDFGLNIQSFGSSIAGGMDMDGNEYNDMLVGAYISSTSVLVRSRPIVKIKQNLSFEPEQINLDIKDYQLPSGRRVSSFNVTTCFSAKGFGIPNNIDVQYTLQLDARLTSLSRAAFVQENSLESSELTQIIQLTKNEEMRCHKHLVYVKTHIQEKNLPIGVRLTYDLAPEMSRNSPANLEVRPILNETPPPNIVLSLLIKNTCKNYHCGPDLLLVANTNTEKVAIGDDWEFRVDVSVTNNGEDAYESSFQAVIPEGTAFVRVERISTDLSVTCLADEENGVVNCDIGNPLPEEHTVYFGMIIRNDQLSGAHEKLFISMMVDSLNYEPKNITGDNFANVTVGVFATAELSLYGVSTPEQILYIFPNASQQESLKDPETEQEVGPEVLHLYMLRNLGPSEVGATRIKIHWPLVDTDGDYILYLVSAALGTGEACSVEGGVNPEDLELEQGNINATGQSASSLVSSDQNTRKRRQSGGDIPVADTQRSLPVKIIECNETSARCVTITCNVTAPSGVGEDEDSSLIRIKSRLYEKTFIEKLYTEVLITSTAEATVLSMPYMQSILPSMFATAFSEASTQVIGQYNEVNPGKLPTSVRIPLWVYIVASIGGGLLLTVIVLVLWKCGFFKRKKIVPGDPKATAQENWENDVLADGKK